jgi:hypothetical protein
MHYKSIGVTGTRHGLSIAQRKWFKDFLEHNSANVLHHGDCVGVDAEVATEFSNQGSYIIAHPGNSRDAWKAYCPVNDLILTWRENLERNKTLADCSSLMLCFPLTETESLQSGTWFTIRYIRKQEIPFFVITPSGSVISNDS